MRRLEADRALAVSKVFHPDTLATLAIKAHRLRHETDPRKQTCTLLTELLRRFPGCASTAAVVEEVEGDPNQHQNTALNLAVECMNYAAVVELLALDPPASFLTLDGLQCSAVGTAIAQLKNVKEGERLSVLQALGTIITAFADRAEASSPPDDWADIRAPIVVMVNVLQKRFTKPRDRQLTAAPWRRLLDLWVAADDVDEPLRPLPGALPAVTPPAAAPPATTSAVVASGPSSLLGPLPVSRTKSFDNGNYQEMLHSLGFGKSKPPVVKRRMRVTNASYLFEATWCGRPVVVKQPNPALLSSEVDKQDMREKRYWQEFKFHQRLKHKNIVELLECFWNDNTETGATQGVIDNTLHLVFDYFPLGSLADVLRSFRFDERKPAPGARVVRLLLQGRRGRAYMLATIHPYDPAGDFDGDRLPPPSRYGPCARHPPRSQD